MDRRFAATMALAAGMIVFCHAVPAAGEGAADPEAVKYQSLITDYLAGAGDMLNVVVWKNEELTDEYLVRPDGKFTMPLVGDIIAAGKTTDAINMQIEQKLKLFIDAPFVSVIVADAASNHVYILGEVAQPGVYRIQGTLTVLQALALAGGFTEFARRNEMVVIRMDGTMQSKYRVSYNKIIYSEDGDWNLLLRRGDTLVVP